MVMVLAVALLAVASTASAAVFGKGKTQITFGLTQFETNSVDTIFFSFDTHNALGFGANFKHGVADHWAIELGGLSGFASEKYEVSGAEQKYSVNAFGFAGHLDYTENIGEMFGVYMGPGF